MNDLCIDWYMNSPQPYFSQIHEIFLEFGIIVMFVDFDVCIKKDLEVHNFLKRLST